MAVSKVSRAVLFLDADILVYNALSAAEEAHDWGENVWTLTCDHNQAWDSFHQRVDDLVKKVKIGGYKEVTPVFCYSDTHRDTPNWRKAILPSYKSNRSGTRKPVGYPQFEARLREAQKHQFSMPGFEGDDIIGIKVTAPNPNGVVRIIWSADKDLKQIPGLHLNTKDGTEVGLVSVSEFDADYFHMFQTLTGDPTDGYKGCPGIGEAKAKKLLSGQPETWWPNVVKAYENAGLDANEALTQALVARIRRYSDGDMWSPPNLKGDTE